MALERTVNELNGAFVSNHPYAARNCAVYHECYQCPIYAENDSGGMLSDGEGLIS